MTSTHQILGRFSLRWMLGMTAWLSSGFAVLRMGNAGAPNSDWTLVHLGMSLLGGCFGYGLARLCGRYRADAALYSLAGFLVGFAYLPVAWMFSP